METKNEFKIRILKWLAEYGIIPPKNRVRVFNTRRYGNEVRIYQEPMEYTNTRKSFRERKEERDEQRHGTYGIHTRKISLYVHINEEDMKSKDERDFILEQLDYLKDEVFRYNYFYNGCELYNIKKIEDFSGHDLLANWKDKDEDYKEKLGKFKIKELEKIRK